MVGRRSRLDEGDRATGLALAIQIVAEHAIGAALAIPPRGAD